MLNNYKESFIPHEMKSTVIKIFSYQHKTPQGILINPYFQNEASFSSLVEMLLLLDEMQNSLSYPQSTVEFRSFQPVAPPAPQGSRLTEPSEKPLATFKINVMFRQNASWQGSILWIEEKSESQFRSVLELIKLIDSVLA